MQNTTNNLKNFSVLPYHDNPNDICNNGILYRKKRYLYHRHTIIIYRFICLIMKIFARHQIPVIPICLLLLSLMISCQLKRSTNVVITVKDPGDEVFLIDDYFKVDKTVYVNAGGSFLLSHITDTYFTNEYAYILDSGRLILKIDLNTGDIVGLTPTGMPINCMTGDDQYVYLLSTDQNNSIRKYNLDLEFVEELSIDRIHRPSSFIKTQDGFMIFNTKEDRQVGRYVLTDNECLKASSFLRSQDLPPRPKEPGSGTTVYPHYLFRPLSRGKMLCFDPEQNQEYLFDGKRMRRVFNIKTDDGLTGSRPPVIKQVYSLDRKTLISYTYNRNRCMVYYDRKYNLIAQGVMPSTENGVHIDPIIMQVGNGLIRIDLTSIQPHAVVPGKSVQARIIYYSPR